MRNITTLRNLHTPQSNPVLAAVQDTVLDMASLGPVLDEAFAAAGILLRPEVVSQQKAEPAAAAAAVRRRLH